MVNFWRKKNPNENKRCFEDWGQCELFTLKFTSLNIKDIRVFCNESLLKNTALKNYNLLNDHYNVFCSLPDVYNMYTHVHPALCPNLSIIHYTPCSPYPLC